MNITHFIPTLGMGGAEAVVREYAIELKKRGHDVTVVVLLPFTGSDNEVKLRNAGIHLISIYEEIYILKSLCLPLRVIRKPFRDRRVQKWIRKYISCNRLDVFHTHLETLHYIEPGICKITGTKLFFTCHSMVDYYFGDKDCIEYKSAIKHLDKDNLQMFALSVAMKDELNKCFGIDTAQVMYNPIDVGRFSSSGACHSRSEFDIGESDLVVGHVGRFIEHKNHRFIVDVFAQLVKVRPDSKLVLVGDGPLVTDIKSRCQSLGIEDKVIFTLGRTDIPEILPLFDVFLFPSKMEGFGISLIEAQTKVGFCVSSDIVPVDTAITDNICYLGLDKPVSVWVDAILNPDRYRIRAVNKLSDFDTVNVVERLVGFYEQ